MTRLFAAASLDDLTEKEWQAQVVQLAKSEGWLVEEQLPRGDRAQRPLETAPQPTAGLGDSLIGTDICDLTLEGDPTTKGRARVAGRRAYTPTKTAAAEEAIRWQILAAGVSPDGDHLVRVTATFRTATRQRRDLDNLLKLVFDACNGFAWRDDVQVEEIQARVERPSDRPGIDLRITRTARYTRDCRLCGRLLAGSGRGTDFCSRACYDTVQRKGYPVACPECGTTVYRQRSEESRLKFCSQECSRAYKAGRRQPRWDVGFPTLALVRERIVFVETAATGELTDDQREWLRALLQAGAEAYVARPRDLEALASVLAARWKVDTVLAEQTRQEIAA
jgi:Holliday junction resolvase RusA-like endonuclease